MALNLVQAHAMMMILAWMNFGSIGIVIARYCRSIRFGRQRQCLGKALWFQIHRCLLSLTCCLTILGFYFILIRSNGNWVNPRDSLLRFFHSIFGCIIVCCTVLQIWLALYRCNPRSRFRFIFDWTHRLTGLLGFCLFAPTVLLMLCTMSKARLTLIGIVFVWTSWTVVACTIFEIIDYRQRRINAQNNAPIVIIRADHESNTNQVAFTGRVALIRLIILLLHALISIVLSVAFLTIFIS